MDTGLWSLAIGGLLVGLSWIGLGWALHGLLRAQRILRSDWSLFAAIGMAVVIAIGGITTLCRITGPISLNAITVLGLALAIIAGMSHRSGVRRPADFTWLPLAIAGAALYLASVYSAQLNPADDLLAYMVFPTQLLHTGTLLDPFVMRRLGTYGGHALLEGQLLAAAQLLGPRAVAICQTHGHVLDSGLCTLIAGGLIWSLIRPGGPRQRLLALVAVAAFFLMPIPRANTYAQSSGTVLFLALAHVLPRLRRTRGLQAEFVAGLLGAGVATLRMNFAAGAAIALALAGGHALFRRRGFHWRAIPRFAVPLLLMFAFLIPWAMVLMQSSGTPFYPLIRGFQQGAFLHAPMTFAAHFHWSAASLLYPPLLLTLFPLIFAVVLHRRGDAMPLYGGAILMAAALAWEFTNEDTANIYRLSSPLLFACVWVTFSHLLKRWDRLAAPLRWGGLLLLLATPCVASCEFSDAFRFSYSLWVLPLVLAAPWVITWRWNAQKIVLAFLAALLAGWLAMHDRSRLSDNGSIFFFIGAMLAFAWSAWLTRRRSVRLLAAGAAFILMAQFLIGISAILGWPLLASVLVGLGAIVFLFWHLHPPHAFARLAAVVLVLSIAAIHRAFLFDHFAAPIVLAALALAAWAAWRPSSRAVKAMALLAVTFLLLTAAPDVSILSSDARWLPLACAAIGGACLLLRSSSRGAASAAILFLAASVVLALPLITSLRMPRRSFTGYPPALLTLYAEAQRTVPAGATIFALVPEPACLSFDRNTIDFADYQMHLVSPPTASFAGLPIGASAQALCAYWKSLGIRYVMLSRDGMKRDGGGVPLSFQYNLSILTQTQRVTFLSAHLSVVDLGQ